MPDIRVVITDDHSIVRSGLKQLLGSVPGIRVVGEAGDGAALLSLLRGQEADVALVDHSMPGLAGVDLIRRLQTDHPRLPVLVLSMHVEAQIVSRMLRAGAAGYVSKDCDPADLVAATRKLAAGGRYIDPSLVDSVVFHAPGPDTDASPHEQLSPRELQVLQAICAGRPLGQIADELHLSPKTVSTHKMRLMQKLDLRSNADLLKYAMRHGLTTA